MFLLFSRFGETPGAAIRIKSPRPVRWASPLNQLGKIEAYRALSFCRAQPGANDRREVEARGAHSNPRSAKLKVREPATMKWSSTFTSTSASASFRLRVSSSSAWLGCATPLG